MSPQLAYTSKVLINFHFFDVVVVVLKSRWWMAFASGAERNEKCENIERKGRAKIIIIIWQRNWEKCSYKAWSQKGRDVFVTRHFSRFKWNCTIKETNSYNHFNELDHHNRLACKQMCFFMSKIWFHFYSFKFALFTHSFSLFSLPFASFNRGNNNLLKCNT